MKKLGIRGVLIILGFTAVLSLALVVAIKTDAGKASPPPVPENSTTHWSGSGPDCTPDGHPDPNHPGQIISDQYTEPCYQMETDELEAKFGADARVRCAGGVDEYLKSVARYDIKWDDGLLESKFDLYKENSRDGVLTVVSKHAMLQNGYGAFQRVVINCDYDTVKGAVVGYTVMP